MAFIVSWNGRADACPGSYGFVVSVVVELELSVFAFTTLPCLFFAFVVLFEVLVVDVEPEGSDAELVVVVDLSVFTFRPLSEVEVAVVEVESLDCVVCAIMAAAVTKIAIIVFMAGDKHVTVHPREAPQSGVFRLFRPVPLAICGHMTVHGRFRIGRLNH